MLDIYGIRKSNFDALAQQLRESRHKPLLEKDVAAGLDLTASHYSQIKSGGTVIGDALARKIETTMNLPYAWMDNIHQKGGAQVTEAGAPYVSQGLRIDPATIAAALRLVRLAFLHRDQVINQEENGEPLAHAYEFLMARRESAATAENVVEFGLALKRRQSEGGGNDVQPGIDRSTSGNRRSRVTRSEAS
ncbi:hypothetical protein CSC62_07450 [Pseudoxanthomonas jiangsuensis]|nr:hypothetical protein CSC62_07450 [Pseudoxanthomonas jiangsuensis]